MASNPYFNKHGLNKSSKQISLNSTDPLTKWEQPTSYFVALRKLTLVLKDELQKERETKKVRVSLKGFN